MCRFRKSSCIFPPHFLRSAPPVAFVSFNCVDPSKTHLLYEGVVLVQRLHCPPCSYLLVGTAWMSLAGQRISIAAPVCTSWLGRRGSAQLGSATSPDHPLGWSRGRISTSHSSIDDFRSTTSLHLVLSAGLLFQPQRSIQQRERSQLDMVSFFSSIYGRLTFFQQFTRSVVRFLCSMHCNFYSQTVRAFLAVPIVMS